MSRESPSAAPTPPAELSERDTEVLPAAPRALAPGGSPVETPAAGDPPLCGPVAPPPPLPSTGLPPAVTSADDSLELEIATFALPTTGGADASVEQSSSLGPASAGAAFEFLLLEQRADRYHETEVLGRGGMGVVVATRDRVLGREVAMKRLLDPSSASDLRSRFLEEARVTAQLEHPNIVPVHDLAVYPEGELFFTMKRVHGRSLGEILQARAAGDAATSAEFSLVRLLTVFQQVCMGVGYAHSRGVLHRDLKPANIMIGDFGEVHVMDWGVARVLSVQQAPHTGGHSAPQGAAQAPSLEDSFGDSPTGPVLSVRALTEERMTMMGTVMGTPEYMSPEQAMGLADVGPASDLFALGVILYEILTGQTPFRGPTAMATLLNVTTAVPRPPSAVAPDRETPPELEGICLRALAKQPADRQGSARELFDAIEAYLEGTAELRRRQREADVMWVKAQGHNQRVAALRARLDATLAQALALRQRLAPQDPVAAKRPLWALEDEAASLRQQARAEANEALNALHHALEHMPEHRGAREALARHHFERWTQAEEQRAEADVLFFRSQVQRYNDGQLDSLLRDTCPVVIRSQPPGAQVTLSPLSEVDRRCVAGPPAGWGTTPLALPAVRRGFYLLQVRAPGCEELKLPVEVGRQSEVEINVRVFRPGDLPEGFVHIPAGVFRMGDPFQARGAGEHGAGSLPLRSVPLPDYAIARLPVTVAQYVAFLNSLAAVDPRIALRRSPRDFGQHYWPIGTDGRFALPIVDRDGDAWDPRWPVMSVSLDDAQAYCAWRSERLGRTVRLPSEAEWEKAARGVDGRSYPWGDHFDPSFCKMRSSRPQAPVPEPVGTFPADESPYGVRDMAGTVREWCGTELEPGLWVIKGGAWNLHAHVCRASHRQGHSRRATTSSIGFRLALDLV